MFIRFGFLSVFVFLVSLPTYAVEFCPIKVIAVSKLDCSQGLTYVGPLNKFKFGGYCIYPLDSCIAKVEFASSPKCITQIGGSQKEGKYVGARQAGRFGGQCLYPAANWKIETRQVSDIKTCQAPEIYLGPAKAGQLGGHCVKISK